jgi:hypothetical protein
MSVTPVGESHTTLNRGRTTVWHPTVFPAWSRIPFAPMTSSPPGRGDHDDRWQTSNNDETIHVPSERLDGREVVPARGSVPAAQGKQAEPTEPQAANEGALVQQVVNLKKRNRRMAALLAAMGVLTVVAVCTAVVLYVGNGTDTKTTAASPSPTPSETSTSSGPPTAPSSSKTGSPSGTSLTTSSTSSSSNAIPVGGVPGQAVLLKDLQRPGGSSSGAFSWVTLDLAGTTTEEEGHQT